MRITACARWLTSLGVIVLLVGCGDTRVPVQGAAIPDHTTLPPAEPPPPVPAAPSGPFDPDHPDRIETPSGLAYIDVSVGTGAEAQPGDRVEVHYTGWLLDGTQFDSSHQRGSPFPFLLGAGKVIKGWDEGVAGMRVGGTRQLIIPPELGYGSRGSGRLIPPDSTLLFHVDLLGIEGR